MYSRSSAADNFQCPPPLPGAINIPPIGSNLNVPDIFIPKNEDKKEEKENNEEDNSLQASGSDVDSLSSMTESSGKIKIH